MEESIEYHVLRIEPSYTMIFYGKDSEVLKLDQQGFHFKGKTIKDAGKAYKIFIDFMQKAGATPDTTTEE